MGALRKFLGNQCTYEIIAVTTEEMPALALLIKQLYYSPPSAFSLSFAVCLL